MEELIKKLKDAGKLETIETEEDLRTAAKELGYSDEDVDDFMSELPLDDDALDQAAGGFKLNLRVHFDDYYGH